MDPMLFTRFLLIFTVFTLFAHHTHADSTTYYPSYSQTTCSSSPYIETSPPAGLDPTACFNYLNNSYNVRYGTSVGLAVAYLYPFACNGPYCEEGWKVCGNDQFASGCCLGNCLHYVAWSGTVANPAQGGRVLNCA
jgi:hypothetical protein